LKNLLIKLGLDFIRKIIAEEIISKTATEPKIIGSFLILSGLVFVSL